MHAPFVNLLLINRRKQGKKLFLNEFSQGHRREKCTHVYQYSQSELYVVRTNSMWGTFHH